MTATTIEEVFSGSTKYSRRPLDADFEIFFNDLDRLDQVSIKRAISNASRAYTKAFYGRGVSSHSEGKKDVKVYIFDNIDKYVHYGKLFDFDTNNQGLTRITTREDGSTFTRIYIYRRGEFIVSLRHEIIHSLMSHLINKMQPVLVEGIAEYIETRGRNITGQELQNALFNTKGEKSLRALLELEDEKKHRHAGLLVVTFFETEHPNYLDQYLERLANNKNVSIDPDAYQEQFSEWINSLCARDVKDTDAVRVLPDYPVRNGIREAGIGNCQEVAVGYIPIVEVMFYQGTLRVYCAATKDYIDVSPEYCHMKAVSTDSGNFFGLLCNEERKLYIDTPEYKLQTKRFFSEQLPATRRIAELERLYSEQSELEAMISTKFDLDEALADELREITARLADTTWIRNFEHIMLRKLERERLKKAELNGEIFRLVPQNPDDVHKIHANVSVVDTNGQMVGELDTATAWFDADGKFHYSDSATNRYMTQSQPVYVTRSEDDELRFVADLTGNRPTAVRINPLFRLDHRYIDQSVFDFLHPKYEARPSLPLMTLGQYSISKGELMDRKELTHRHDDVYTAVLKKDGRTITTLRYVGMYAIDNTLFVHDFANGKRYQLSADVRWLKLVQDESGQIYLCPATNGGETVWKESLLLDPTILHTFSDGNKTGLVDVNDYKMGTAFECKIKDNAVELYETEGGRYVGRMAIDQYAFVGDLLVSFGGALSTTNPSVTFENDYFIVGGQDDPVFQNRRVYIKAR